MEMPLGLKDVCFVDTTHSSRVKTLFTAFSNGGQVTSLQSRKPVLNALGKVLQIAYSHVHTKWVGCHKMCIAITEQCIEKE